MPFISNSSTVIFPDWYKAYRYLITASGAFLILALLMAFVYAFCRTCAHVWMIIVVVVCLIVSGVKLLFFISLVDRRILVIISFLLKGRNFVHMVSIPIPDHTYNSSSDSDIDIWPKIPVRWCIFF